MGTRALAAVTEVPDRIFFACCRASWNALAAYFQALPVPIDIDAMLRDPRQTVAHEFLVSCILRGQRVKSEWNPAQTELIETVIWAVWDAFTKPAQPAETKEGA